MAGVTNRYASAEMEPYVTGLGQLALAWNDLQEELCEIYCSLFSAPSSTIIETLYLNNTALASWSSIRSDRSQRLMLKAVAESPLPSWAVRKEFLDEVIWLVDQANALEDSRSNSIHAPLQNHTDGILFQIMSLVPLLKRNEAIAPATRLNNFRALKLGEKEDILSEFFFCRDTAITLRMHAEAIRLSQVGSEPSLPRRPSLPNRVPKKIQPPKPNHHTKKQP